MAGRGLLLMLSAAAALAAAALGRPDTVAASGGSPQAEAASVGDIAALSLPDLVILKMRIELQDPNSCLPPGGAQLGVRIELKNQGKASAGPFVVDVNGAQQNHSGLAPGASADLWFTGYKSFENNTGTVDATSVVTESDETNNTNSKLLPVPTPPPSCTPTPTPPPVGGIAEFAEGQSSGGANTLVALIAALALAGGALALVALLRSR